MVRMDDPEERDPVRDASWYMVERASAPSDPTVDVSSRADDQERREREDARAERLRRDRAATQHLWIERQVEAAMSRGEFDDLPLAGKPIPGLGRHDPDWWVRSLVEREQLSGLAPESVLLRREDAALDSRLDRLAREPEVRAVLEEFNARVLTARCRADAGPPVVTPQRDVEDEVLRWRERRSSRR